MTGDCRNAPDACSVRSPSKGLPSCPPIRAPASRAHRASAPANVSPKKSSPMKDKHYLHRVAIVRLVDSLFYETGNARWSHSRCCSLITGSLCGIGTSTHRNYLHFDRPELLAEVELPAALRELFRLYVLLIKKFPAARTADLLQALYIIAKTRCNENQNEMRFFEGVNSPKRNVTKISHAHEKHRSNGC